MEHMCINDRRGARGGFWRPDGIVGMITGDRAGVGRLDISIAFDHAVEWGGAEETQS